MGAYILRRLGALVLMLWVLSILVFLLFNAVPTDPAALTCGKSCTPDVIAANRIRLGLDKPLLEQYWLWLSAIFVGRTYGSGSQTFECHAPCLGYSFRQGAEVLDLISARIPVTLQLALGAFILWMLFGVIGGIYAALRRGRWQDRTIVTVALVGYSFPSFFIGLLLIFFVIIRAKILPFPAYQPPTENFQAWIQTMILPWISIALLYAAFYVRLTRNQMLETLSEDFVRTARAKGLPEKTVIRRHAFRAGLTPIVTAAGLDFAGLLGGAIITEQIFGLPGLGKLAIESVVEYDLPLITGVTLLAAAFIIVANLVVDVLYAWIDPRVRVS